MIPESDVVGAEEAARRLLGAMSGGTSRAEIHIHAGGAGIGIWIATTACLVMLACGLVGALWMSREFSRYDARIAELQANDRTQGDYLAAIYMQAPQLKPKQED